MSVTSKVVFSFRYKIKFLSTTSLCGYNFPAIRLYSSLVHSPVEPMARMKIHKIKLYGELFFNITVLSETIFVESASFQYHRL